MIKPQNARNGLLGSLLFGLASLASAQTLLNVSYDVSREFFKDYNAAFVAHYKKTKVWRSKWISRMPAPAPKPVR